MSALLSPIQLKHDVSPSKCYGGCSGLIGYGQSRRALRALPYDLRRSPRRRNDSTPPISTPDVDTTSWLQPLPPRRRFFDAPNWLDEADSQLGSSPDIFEDVRWRDAYTLPLPLALTSHSTSPRRSSRRSSRRSKAPPMARWDTLPVLDVTGSLSACPGTPKRTTVPYNLPPPSLPRARAYRARAGRGCPTEGSSSEGFESPESSDYEGLLGSPFRVVEDSDSDF